jgi:PEGA domain
VTNRFTVTAVAALALFVASPTRADDVADAKARFRKGAELYRAGMWREAIAEFEVAYKLKPAGAIHFNIAQCRERLSEWPGALRAYTDYLREVPDATDRPAVRASIGKIERRLAASGVQALLVYSDPPGASVVLEGRARGTTPFHVSLPPGKYALALTLDGYEPAKHEIALSTEVSRVVDVVLRTVAPAASASAPASTVPPLSSARPAAPGRASAPAAGVAPSAARAAPSAAGAPTPHPVLPPPDLKAQPPKGAGVAGVASNAPPPKPTEKRRVYTWIAAGAAVAAVAAGGYFGLAARGDADAIREMSTADGDRARRLESSAQSKRRTANALYVAGGVAGAAGMTLFFVEKRF